MNGITIDTGDTELDTKIQEWFTWNKDKVEAKEARKLLEKCETHELRKYFLERIEFGTAGLRGRMGPGFSQMNDLVVIQTAQGILHYLESLRESQRGIVIGYDGRYKSRRFAELTAGIFLRAGAPVYLTSRVCPTPFVPFSVNIFKAAAGVMVTASHNPKEDNGYKVYWSNGSQIIFPHDKQIKKHIEEELEPSPVYWDISKLDKSPNLLSDPLDTIMPLYYDIVRNSCFDLTMNMETPFRVTYTAMHGVGYPYIVEAFKMANFHPVIPVEEQIDPDPEFPTVKFPNPEEGESALNLAFQTADTAGSPLILANDPDADRLAVAEKSSDGEQWKVFSGNEIGALLGWWHIYKYKKKHPVDNYKNVYLLSSTVSSKIVKTIATAEGFSFEETLTGFKWMGNKAYDLIYIFNKKVIFAFEEAIGFMCGSGVLDKDGVSAAVAVTELAAYLHEQNETLAGKLQWIYSQYGHHLSDNSYFICHDPASINKCFERLRNYNAPDSYPDCLMKGKYKVCHVRDLTTGYDSSQPGCEAVLPVSPSSHMITFTFNNGFIVTLRTSGTEPKVKYYTELCASPQLKNLEEVKSTQKEMVKAIIDEFLQPEKYGFIYRS